MQKSALYVAGLIFAVSTIAHAVRVITGFGITINGFAVPTWLSYPGVLIAAALTLWMLAAARRA